MPTRFSSVAGSGKNYIAARFYVVADRGTIWRQGEPRPGMVKIGSRSMTGVYLSNTNDLAVSLVS